MKTRKTVRLSSRWEHHGTAHDATVWGHDDSGPGEGYAPDFRVGMTISSGAASVSLYVTPEQAQALADALREAAFGAFMARDVARAKAAAKVPA